MLRTESRSFRPSFPNFIPCHLAHPVGTSARCLAPYTSKQSVTCSSTPCTRDTQTVLEGTHKRTCSHLRGFWSVQKEGYALGGSLHSGSWPWRGPLGGLLRLGFKSPRSKYVINPNWKRSLISQKTRSDSVLTFGLVL